MEIKVLKTEKLDNLDKILLDFLRDNDYSCGKFEINVNAERDRVVIFFIKQEKKFNHEITLKTEIKI